MFLLDICSISSFPFLSFSDRSLFKSFIFSLSSSSFYSLIRIVIVIQLHDSRPWLPSTQLKKRFIWLKQFLFIVDSLCSWFRSAWQCQSAQCFKLIVTYSWTNRTNKQTKILRHFILQLAVYNAEIAARNAKLALYRHNRESLQAKDSHERH